MKSLKKVLAALLAAVIVITGGAFAFAADTDTVIEWNIEDADFTFNALYAGEAKEGNFIVKAMEEYEDVYYTFNAEKAGYYTITFDWYPVDYCLVAETYADGKASGDRENLVDNDGQKVVNTYYLDAGVNYICFNLYEEDSSDSYAEIEFLGEEITNIIFDETEIETLLIGTEIYEYEYEDGFYWVTDIEIEFDSNKKIAYDYFELVFDMKAPLEKGEVELTLNFMNYSKDYVVTAYEITDVVSSARVVEESSKKVEILYNGAINADRLDGMTLEVTFTNGEKATGAIESGYADIKFPNGKTFYFEVYYNNYETDGEICLEVLFPNEDGDVFLHQTCEKIEASKDANKEAFKENVAFPFELSWLIFQWDISEISNATSIGEVLAVIFATMSDSAYYTEWAFNNLFTQLFAYIGYLFAF